MIEQENRELLGKSKVSKWCEEKFDKLEKNLLDFFEQNKSNLKNMNIYPIITNMLSIDNEINKMKERSFDDPEDVEFCFSSFKEIMSTINLNVIYVPSQQSFCTFMGWTDRVYKNMLHNSTEDIQDMMQSIDEYIIENQLSAGQVGFAKQNLTKFRAQLSGNHGQGLVTQKEEHEIARGEKKIKSKEELLKELNNMGSRGTTIENSEKLIK
ncbi:MAG: hypothetical protein RR585_01860 [Coprobacillus sp.]